VRIRSRRSQFSPAKAGAGIKEDVIPGLRSLLYRPGLKSVAARLGGLRYSNLKHLTRGSVVALSDGGISQKVFEPSSLISKVTVAALVILS